MFVDLCKIHFSLNYSSQVIDSDHVFTLIFTCHKFSFKEDTSKGP